MKQARYHIVIDISEATQGMTDSEGLAGFLSNLTEKIGMHALFGPIVKEGIPENPGLTGFTIIDFSHISVHTFTDSEEVFVDIFSCKPYDQDLALSMTLDYFGAQKAQSRINIVHWGA